MSPGGHNRTGSPQGERTPSYVNTCAYLKSFSNLKLRPSLHTKSQHKYPGTTREFSQWAGKVKHSFLVMFSTVDRGRGRRQRSWRTTAVTKWGIKLQGSLQFSPLADWVLGGGGGGHKGRFSRNPLPVFFGVGGGGHKGRFSRDPLPVFFC